MKQLLALTLLSLNVAASELVIHEHAILAAKKFGVSKVLRGQNDYYVLTDNGLHKVNKHDVSNSLKTMNNAQLTSFLNGRHGVIKVEQFTNGEFKLKEQVYGNGGGFFGFWLGATLGKVLVSTVGYGTITLISGLTGPAAIWVAPALTTTFAPYIEGAGVYAAAVGGMTLGATTGPI